MRPAWLDLCADSAWRVPRVGVAGVRQLNSRLAA